MNCPYVVIEETYFIGEANPSLCSRTGVLHYILSVIASGAKQSHIRPGALTDVV